jgi:hypothetical protein
MHSSATSAKDDLAPQLRSYWIDNVHATGIAATNNKQLTILNTDKQTMFTLVDPTTTFCESNQGWLTGPCACTTVSGWSNNKLQEP